LQQKGHQGVTTNTTFQNENGSLIVPYAHDLDELYADWASSGPGTKGVDVYV
jgi:hypothetical protein